MWLAEHFVAAGCLTGVDNTLRFFRLQKSLRGFSLLLVRLALCAHIIAGVGTTDSCATPRSDHRNYV
jgi:hypothetical protein